MKKSILLSVLLVFIISFNCFADTAIIYAPSNEDTNRRRGYIESGYTTNRQNITFKNLDNTNSAGILLNGNVIKVDMGTTHNRLHFKLSINEIKPQVANIMSVYLNNKLIHSNSLFETTPEDYWIWINEPGLITIRFSSIHLDTGEIEPNTFIVLNNPEIYWENTLHYSYR